MNFSVLKQPVERVTFINFLNGIFKEKMFYYQRFIYYKFIFKMPQKNSFNNN